MLPAVSSVVDWRAKTEPAKECGAVLARAHVRGFTIIAVSELDATAGSGSAAAAARQVASIVAAAEAAAERMRLHAEQRVRDRIAEGERAGQNRVQAAEEEAAEIVKLAREEAARLREAGRVDAEKARADATSEALATIGRAKESADQTARPRRRGPSPATSTNACSQRAGGVYYPCR